MRLRSAFLSPPAVAGLALLAIVIGVAFALRLGGTPDDRTDVAGTVVERPEPTEAAEPTAPPVDDDPIVVPLDEPVQDEAEDEDTVAAPPPAVDPPPPADEPGPVGLIPDSDPADDGAGPSNGNGTDDEGPEEPEETESPRNNPPPPTETEEPEPTPTPAQTALGTGEGHSRDTALAEGDDWLIREVSDHGRTSPDTSREAAARLTVGFNDAARTASGGVRSFSCQAWLTAGDERLTTDRDHVFEIALVSLDDNGAVDAVVASVIERQAYDLQPGDDTLDQRMSTTAVELDAADEIDYGCVAVYRER